LSDQQNDSKENSSMMNNAVKNFDILAIHFSVFYYYFDNSIKLFSDLYLTKFVDTSIKPFFSCVKQRE